MRFDPLAVESPLNTAEASIPKKIYGMVIQAAFSKTGMAINAHN